MALSFKFLNPNAHKKGAHLRCSLQGYNALHSYKADTRQNVLY